MAQPTPRYISARARERVRLATINEWLQHCVCANNECMCLQGQGTINKYYGVYVSGQGRRRRRSRERDLWPGSGSVRTSLAGRSAVAPK